MELIAYIRLVRRWAWLLILAAFVGGSVSYIARSSQPATYQAQTLIAIGGSLQSPNPDNQDISTGIQLVQTYAVIVRTNEILQGAVDTLNAPLSAGDLNNALDTQIVSGTSLLRLSVTYTDPVLAADLVNELARQLVLNSPSNIPAEQQAQVDLLKAQVATITEDLTSLRTELESIDAELADENLSDSRRTTLTDDRRRIIDQINKASNNIAGFTNTIASIQQLTNSVEIVETARIPTDSVGAGAFSTVILGAMVSASLAFGVVLLMETLNDTFRSADEITHTLQVPVLGVISKIDAADDAYASKLLTNQASASRSQDEYRILRTNLLFTAENRKGIYIVSSPSPQEGKSVTAANLAVSMARAGLRVLLIDADLRRPRVHEIFGIENVNGLTSLLSRKGNLPSVDSTSPASRGIYWPESWKECVQQTTVENLQVMTSGFIPENPTELLGSALMKRWVDIFKESPHIDIVIFDTPPSLAFSDGPVLAASLAARVLLVFKASTTRRSAGEKTKERFEQVGAEVVGVVLNNANLSIDDYYGYGYGYYYYDKQTSASNANIPNQPADRPTQ
jgi:non-specific protein-tyrosine kinase